METRAGRTAKTALIVTGWGWTNSAAAAAAVAARFFRDAADLTASSRNRLPETLSDAIRSGYPRIVIIGVPIGDASPYGATPLDRLSETLRNKSKATSVELLSDVTLPESARRAIEGSVTLIEKPGEDLIAIAEAHFGIDTADIRAAFKQKARPAKGPALPAPYFELLEAAAWHYRRLQDQTPFKTAIRSLADGTAPEEFSPAQHSLLSEYRRFGGRELRGDSASLNDLRKQIATLAPKDGLRVLIVGESGTGKETVALELHSRSKRCDEPFISLNCATTNPQLLESMLFGHEKGAFTGADEKHDGVFIQADGGTLFLDEIGELPFDAQGLLLRVLEGGGFRRMKGKEDIHVDVRLICATHRNLAQMVAEKKFRADLMYRILGALVSVAPLRKRPEDIITIANHGWYSLRKRPLTDAQRAALASYSWPGNVRELQNFIGRADALDESDFGKLLAEHMAFFENAAGTREPDGIPDRLEELKAWHISRILKRHSGNISDAAQTLGIARSTVRKFSALT